MHRIRLIPLALMLAAGIQLPGCGKKEPAASATAEVAPAGAPAVAPAEVAAPDAAVSSWSAEALEDLLAPVALYPDPVLAQVLATSVNPQEVLDAGNWLVQNPDLTGKPLESAGLAAGFTPPMIAMLQFPTVVDMMCMEMDWTTELGQAFQADEPGVLDAVQRLRKQAAEMGNLKTSEQMKVVTETQNDQQVIVVQPASPQVVYVPQYDPGAVYTTPAPAPAPAPTGHSTGTLITTGLLAFGAGMLVNEMFDDDHHDNDNYYYPRWGYGYGGPPYYPPPYRPVYGGGFRPAYGYNRPVNYQHGFNNNNVYINNSSKNYWNRFDSDKKNYYRKQSNSPISAARPNRPELQQLNNRARPASTAATRPQNGDWKGKDSYAGAKPENRERAAQTRDAAAGKAKAPTGSYAGAQNRPARDAAQPRPATREIASPKAQNQGARDRGRDSAGTTARSSTKASPASRVQAPASRSSDRKAAPRSNALDGASKNSGKSERAASQRGKASMPKGGQAKGNRANKKGNK